MPKLYPVSPKGKRDKFYAPLARCALHSPRQRSITKEISKRKPGYTMSSRPAPSRQELFESVPIPKALATLAIPTIISQIINLVYNMVDAFFIGRTGNSYMMAATTLTLTLMLMNIAFGNLFGIGGGSLIARLSGKKRPTKPGASAPSASTAPSPSRWHTRWSWACSATRC